MLDLFNLLGVDLGGDTFHVIDGATTEGFQELPIVLLAPVVETLAQKLSVFFFQLLGDLLKIVLQLLDFQRKLLDL